MSLNIGTITTSRVSIGPAIVFLGPSGTTPTGDVGLLTEDGVELEFQSDFVDLMAGNPSNVVQRFITASNAFMRFGLREWGATQLGYALGTGSTTISSSHEILQFGGDPCPDDLAVYLRHRKACVAHTIFVRFWKAQSEQGSSTTTFSATEPHMYNASYKAIRSTLSWAGATLADDAQLVEVDIQLQ